MINTRKASPGDVGTVVGYIAKKAAFDRELGCFDGPLGATEEKIGRALFGTPVFAHALLAEVEGAAVGFAFYHYRFSSFEAQPSLWLDDLYVDEEARRSGAGEAIMAALAQEAIDLGCTHIEWTADAKNPSGVPFYTKLTATLRSRVGNRLEYCIAPEALGLRLAEMREGRIS